MARASSDEPSSRLALRKLSGETSKALASSENYRQFLKVYFRETGLSYAEVARRGGFSSRSYPRDVTEGRRRLTAKSLPSLVRGLRLRPDLAKLFQSLYFTEYPEEHPEACSHSNITLRMEKDRQSALRNIRSPVRKKSSLPDFNQNFGKLPENYAVLMDVLAALGDSEIGATLEEVQQRTGLSKPLLSGVLDLLVQGRIASYRGDSRRFFSGTGHLDWTGQGDNQLAKAMFRSSLDRLSVVADQHFGHQDTMLLHSAISIAKTDLGLLKKELREVILKFVDRAILHPSSSPNTVIQVVAGLFEGKLALPRC